MKKRLSEIIQKDLEILDTYSEIFVSGLYVDSREVSEDGLFFAVSGTQVDGHDFIDQAISNGAKVVVHEKEIEKVDGVTYIKVESVQSVVGPFASLFFGEPSKKMKVVGVTGTNGKTSVVTLLHQMTQSLGNKSGLLSTVVNKIGDKEFESTHTTGGAIQIQENLAKMVESGCLYCFMEVSSHALHQGRTNGIDFNGAIFTNLTQDHLDYHETMEEYFQVKKIFFDNLNKGAFALVNTDDEYGLKIVADTKAQVNTFGKNDNSDYVFEVLNIDPNGLSVKIQKHPIEIPLVGEFNAYNFTSVYISLVLLGFRHDEIAPKIPELKGVPGRMEKISSNGIVGIVDYAHTPDALENVLNTLNTLKGGGRIITVTGCGGDRDVSKRPVMAGIAERLSDVYVLTSDNPRTENPEDILGDMRRGLSGDGGDGFIVEDRREAIKKAVEIAEEDDIVLLAGKGHEDYQIIGTEKIHFDDREELLRFLTK